MPNKKVPTYALYKGDDLIHIGTIAEIADAMQVKPETIAYYRSPTYAKRGGTSKHGRRVLVPIEDDESDNE